MSLRKDVHSAFDVIAPPLGGMPERVVQTVLAEHKARGRKRRMLIRMRAPLSLVAVFLFIALVAAVLVGGRLVQDWNVLHHATPAGPSTYQLQVAELEARPLQVPTFKSASDCNTGPLYNGVGGGFGSGPIYGHSGPTVGTGWGDYYYNFAFADTQVPGPVLVRAVHLFNGQPIIFIGANAAGPVVGSDTLNGKAVQQHSEAVIDTKHTGPTPAYFGDYHQFSWALIAGEPNGSGGGSGWQFDSPGFTETFVVC